MYPSLAGYKVDLVAGAVARIHALFQIHQAVFAEARDHHAGFGVQLDQAIAGGDVEDALLSPVSPIRQAAAGKLARRDRGALPFAEAVDPHQLAGLGIERDHCAPCAGGGVNHSVHHQRRAFQLVFRTRAQVIRLKVPRELELIEVRLVDLVERPVLGARLIRGVISPLGIFFFPLAEGRGRKAHECSHQFHVIHATHIRSLLKGPGPAKTPALRANTGRESVYFTPGQKASGRRLHNSPGVPPQSLGSTSAMDWEKHQWCPAKSSALYCRSPYG